MKPAVAVLSTGSVCFPLNRPVLAFHQPKVSTVILMILLVLNSLCFLLCSDRVSVCIKNAGKLAVLGSCHMFSDQYLDKEENSKIMVRDSVAIAKRQRVRGLFKV